MDPGRARVVFTVVLLSVFVPVVLVLALQAGDDDKQVPGGLTLAIDPNQNTVTASLDSPDLNTAAVANGATAVTFECADRAGKVLARSREPWPFTITDDRTTAPHVHLNVPDVARLATCRVLDTDPPIGGEAPTR